MINIVLDLDTGIDDSMALALAISDENINIVGITTSYGNVNTDVSCQNSRFLLDLFNNETIPVNKGLEHALNTSKFDRHEISSKIHGHNGIGDIFELSEIYKNKIFPNFENFMLEKLDQYDNNITYITTGPLTNLAYLIKKYPLKVKKLSNIISMGGAIIFPGNINTYAEANINQDPEAAKIVLESNIPLTIVPLDVTEKSRLTKKDTKSWADTGSKQGILLSQMVNYYIEQHPEKTECYIHDPSAIMYCLKPEYFTTISKDLTVLIGTECKGRIIGRLSNIRNNKSTTKICLDVNSIDLQNYINETYIRYFNKNN